MEVWPSEPILKEKKYTFFIFWTKSRSKSHQNPSCIMILICELWWYIPHLIKQFFLGWSNLPLLTNKQNCIFLLSSIFSKIFFVWFCFNQNCILNQTCKLMTHKPSQTLYSLSVPYSFSMSVIMKTLLIIKNVDFQKSLQTWLLTVHKRVLMIVRNALVDDKFTYGPFYKGANRILKAILDRDSDPFLIWKLDLTFVNAKLFQIWLLKCEQSGVLARDLLRKPDYEDLWTQSSFGTWFVYVRFGNARWSHAWVNQRSRNKILPCSAQILFVIGMAVAMLMNVHSLNHEPNQEVDRDPRRLSDLDSLLVNRPMALPLKISDFGLSANPHWFL